MSLPRFTRMLALFLLPGSAALVRGDDSDETANQIAVLVSKLGDPVYAVREAAVRDLVAVGEIALPALRKIASSENVEIQRRAATAIRRIILNSRISKSIGLETVVIEPREFQMGSPGNESYRRPDETQHAVRITSPFLIGAYEVTQEEYQKVMKTAPSWFAATGGGKAKVVGTKTDWFPVEKVTWFDAIEFCNQLSKRDGYEPYYKVTAAKRTGESISEAVVKILYGNGYRLPTEAEWELACRAGTLTPFHFGYSNTGREANLKPGPAIGYASNPTWEAVGRTTHVGTYKPNAYGLYDMHGNAGEWCWDWYDKDYPGLAVTVNPQGPDEGRHRVVRSGSWMVNEASCRSASRYFLTPDDSKDYVSFRVARTP